VSAKSPLITILTPVLNGAATISDNLATVSELAKDFELEHKVIDGGSNDGTKKIVEKFNYQGLEIITGSDQGLYDAINKGLRHARGMWINVLNSDDRYDVKGAQEVLSRMRKTSVVRVFHGKARMLCLNGEETRTLLPVARKEMGRSIKGPMHHQTMFIPKAFHDKLGFYNTSFSVAADTDFMYRLIDSGLPIEEYSEISVEVREGGVSYQSYDLLTREFLKVHGNRRLDRRIPSLWKYFKSERLRNASFTPSGRISYWFWAMRVMAGGRG